MVSVVSDYWDPGMVIGLHWWTFSVHLEIVCKTAFGMQRLVDTLDPGSLGYLNEY